MINDNLSTLLDDLEKLRNDYLNLTCNKVEKSLFAMQVNDFVSHFYFAVRELNSETPKSADNEYINYFKSVYFPTRYLLESFLTFSHFASKTSGVRVPDIYGFFLSNRLKVHELDLKIYNLQIDERNESDVLRKIEENRVAYKEMLSIYGKLNNLTKENIDDYFNEDGSLKSKKGLGFKFYDNAKIKYIDEIVNSPFIRSTAKNFLLVHYPLLSLDAHPTPASLFELELFIGSTEKNKKILERTHMNGKFMELSGRLMIEVARHLLKELAASPVTDLGVVGMK